MRRIMLFSFLLLFSISLSAQYFNWVVTEGSSNVESPSCITTDSEGNVILGGKFRGTMDFDPSNGEAKLSVTIGTAGGDDAFIQKLDPNGNLIWAKQLEGRSTETVFGFKADKNNNIYCIGQYSRKVDFNPSPAAADTFYFDNSDSLTSQAFILKLDKNGNFVKALGFGGKGITYTRSIDFDDAENLYITGYITDSIDADPSANVNAIVPIGGNDFFVSKIDKNGSLVWVKSFGGTGTDNANSICVDSRGNSYIYFSFNDTIDFKPGNPNFTLSARGASEMGLLKLSNLGDVIWVKQFGNASANSSSDIISSIKMDSESNLILSGHFVDTVDFNMGAPVYNLMSDSTSSDAFLTKIDTVGNFIWATRFGGKSIETLGTNSLGIDNSNNIYLTGRFYSKIGYKVGVDSLASKGFSDNFIAKFLKNGVPEWAVNYGSTTSDAAPTALAVDTIGSVYVCGTFTKANTAGVPWDFDPGEGNTNTFTAAGSTGTTTDIYILKLGKTIITKSSVDLQSAKVLAYPNPTTNFVTIDMEKEQRNVEVSLFDLTGKQLSQSAHSGKKFTVAINQPAGIYMMRVNAGGYNNVFRIVKK